MKRTPYLLALLACAALMPSPLQAISARMAPTVVAPAVSSTRISPTTTPAVIPETRSDYVKPHFRLPYSQPPLYTLVYDYRPTINALGTRIVFEHGTPVPGKGVYGAPNLQIATLANPKPQPLLNTGQSAARADWCWDPVHPVQDGRIVYSVLIANNPDKTNGVYIAPPQASGTPQFVGKGDDTGWIYPTWYPGCQALAIDASTSLGFGTPPYHDTATTTNPGPTTIKLDLSTGSVQPHLIGQNLWQGFPSVNPLRPQQIVFAGQNLTEVGYNQDNNLIYLADTSAIPPSVAPLDPYQGRAPSWSPDGRYVAFESNRSCQNTSQYAIFILDWMHSKQTRQITDCKYNAQHAKWYRMPVDGKRQLIVSALLYPDYSGPTNLLIKSARGIASLDVTSYFNSQ